MFLSISRKDTEFFRWSMRCMEAPRTHSRVRHSRKAGKRPQRPVEMPEQLLIPLTVFISSPASVNRTLSSLILPLTPDASLSWVVQTPVDWTGRFR